MRNAEIKRDTNETKISLSICLDGKGNADVNTSCPFLDHMLTLFAKHGRFDLTVKCVGDTHVDDHHTVEDIGISLGMAFKEALADKKGIVRYGSMILPMDESLILSAVDFSGRGYLGYNMEIPTEKVGTFDTELVEEFWLGFIRNAECTLHIRQLAGTNSHHIIEGAFKSVGHSFRKACKIDSEFSQDVLSTKGVL